MYRVGIIRRHATTRGVRQPELVLRRGLALLGRQSKLAHPSGSVLGHAANDGAARHSERREAQNTGEGDGAGKVRHQLAPTMTMSL